MCPVKLTVVTGYVPLLDHPRNHEEYARLGAHLGELREAPMLPFRCELRDCWLDAHTRDKDVRHAVADNPKKNTLAYHVVQHQKTAWLMQARLSATAARRNARGRGFHRPPTISPCRRPLWIWTGRS